VLIGRVGACVGSNDNAGEVGRFDGSYVF
jgi:hypothetical protein